MNVMNNIGYEKIHDAIFRDKLRQNPIEVLKEYGFELSKDTQVQVLTNTKNTYYMVLPSAAMELNDLTKLQAAANSVGTVGSVCSFGTVFSFTASLSTVGSLGSISTAGSAGLSSNNEVKL